MRVDGAEFDYQFFAHDKIRESQREMISDGIENCLQYVKNFNPEK